MKFKYVGPGVRVIGKYRWDKSTKFMQDVKEKDLIENLRTYPDNTFKEVKEKGDKDDSTKS